MGRASNSTMKSVAGHATRMMNAVTKIREKRGNIILLRNNAMGIKRVCVLNKRETRARMNGRVCALRWCNEAFGEEEEEKTQSERNNERRKVQACDWRHGLIVRLDQDTHRVMLSLYRHSIYNHVSLNIPTII